MWVEKTKANESVQAFGSDARFWDGISRRRMLQVGGTGLFGGLALPAMLQMQAEASTARAASDLERPVSSATSAIKTFMFTGYPPCSRVRSI